MHAPRRERLLDRLEHSPSHQLGVRGGVEGGREHGELVAPEPGEGVGLAQRRGHPAGELPQHEVPGLVAQAVVDGLEVVEVEQEQPHHVALAAGGGDRPLGPVGEEGAVGQSRQPVVKG